MPSRVSRRSRTSGRYRGPRARTRWFALTPHQVGPFTVDDTWDSQVMELQDIDSIVPLDDFVGGTVLRTLVDFVINPIVGTFDNNEADWVNWVHLGIGLTDDLTPEVAQWDPNDPHAEFMWRNTWGSQMMTRANASGIRLAYQSAWENIFRVDITQRRIIRENQKMWLFAHYFEQIADGGDGSLQIGYTGRVLIKIP